MPLPSMGRSPLREALRRQKLYRPANPEFISRIEAARMLGVSVSTLHHWARAQKGPGYARIGKSTWYLRSDLERWMAAQARPRPEGGQ